MAVKSRLNIEAVKASLIDVQQHFDLINASLKIKRTAPSDEVINNLLAGYIRVNEFVNNEVDLFAIGNSHLLLELNQIVLYYTSDISEDEALHQFKATENHFYKAQNGGIQNLMEWLQMNDGSSIWKRCAGLFTYILSQPQLFLEGNHRTGSLIISYMLMREGYAPFVLSTLNAKHFFEPAEMTKKRRKKTFDEFLHLPKQTGRFAKLLKKQQPSDFLFEH
jgi:hypothetical protein